MTIQNPQVPEHDKELYAKVLITLTTMTAELFDCVEASIKTDFDDDTLIRDIWTVDSEEKLQKTVWELMESEGAMRWLDDNPGNKETSNG